MTEARILARLKALLALLLAACVLMLNGVATAQEVRADTTNHITAELFADGAPDRGGEWTLALHFTPESPEWHGYWSNPGDAGLGMELDWDLPAGWKAGEPQYPVPGTLLIAGLMNHVYEGRYTVLVPIEVPEGADAVALPRIGVTARYLSCTDKICVPETAQLTLDLARAGRDPRFGEWRAAVAPLLDSTARFEISGQRLRIGIPLPASVELGDPHLFLAGRELGGGLQSDFAGVQTFVREGDLLVAEIPLKRIENPSGFDPPAAPTTLEGILSFGGEQGVRFRAVPGEVGLESVAPLGEDSLPALGWLILGALAGGLLLNIMPCVFPILSLKALALARAGGGERAARRDALAYSAGVILASVALGALLLAMRAAGEQVGWAFQLQTPGVVVALLLLATAITANLLGLFEIPGFALSGGSAGGTSSFATGLLAAFVATPCTGPFMAAAMGAALLLPTAAAVLLFAVLGLGLALPFLLLGFMPALRRRLPKPGPWMVRFRKWMALPMGLTALALLWLCWRVGGGLFALYSAVFMVALVAVLLRLGQRQRSGQASGRVTAVMLVGLALVAGLALPTSQDRSAAAQSESLLEPIPFSTAALANARASGKPVFVWFTADWCLSCKVNERVAIEREATRSAFDEGGVIAMRGDWTRRDAEIARFLAAQGAAGIPLYLWYPPGGDAEQLPQLLRPDSLPALARQARSSPPARGSDRSARGEAGPD